MLRLRFLPAVLLPFLLAGCGVTTTALRVAPASRISGSLHGGQQPISGASVQLYVVGTTGDGSAATALAPTPVLTDAGGYFTFNGLNPCPSPSSLVYLAATGGNPGLSGNVNNPAIVGLVAFGACSNLSTSTFFNVNEVTTVAAVNALAPFVTSVSAIGAAPANSSAIANAFALANQYATFDTGLTPGYNLPSGYTAPSAAINTLANIASSCVNSSGSDGKCASLFTDTTPSSPANAGAPTDILGALLNIANNPTLNTSQLFSLAPPAAPFQPMLSATPGSYALALTAIPPPAVTLSPGALTFAAAAVGLPQSAQKLTLTNATAAPVPAPSFALSGTNASDFSVLSLTNACTSPVLPGASCSYAVNFVPGASGSRSAVFTLTSGGTTLTSSLTGQGSGTGAAGPLSLSGAPAYYAAGTLYDLRLTNYGNTPVNFSRIGIDYTRANLQTFTQTNDCAPQLYAQSVCTIHLTVSGVRPIGGYSSAYLNLTDDLAPGTQSYAINQYPDPISPPSGIANNGATINYGGWMIGYTTAASPGQSNGPQKPSVGDATNFKFNLTGNCNTIIHGNYYCGYSLAFTPAVAGPIASSLYDGTTHSLVGYGLPAGAYLKGYFANPVNVVYGRTSTLGGTLSNYGFAKLTLLAPVFSGPDAGAFGPATCTAADSYGGCSYSYSFTPTHLGDSYATISIDDSTGTFHFSQNLDVVASPTLGMFSPAILAFPNTANGTTSATLSTTVSTAYNEAVTVSVAAPFSVVGASSCATTPCTLSFAFSPTYAQSYASQAVIKDMNGISLGSLSLTGTGTAPPVQTTPSVTLSPVSFSFASRPVGSTSIASSGTIANGGNGVLNLTSITLTGSNASDYILSSSCGTTLAVGSSCGYSLSFAPTASGTRTAAISIISNAPSSPDAVSITGIAQ